MANPGLRGALRDENGQLTVGLALVVSVAATGAIMLIAALGGVAVDRARARSAADAAALAGAAEGEVVAREVATDNAGVVESYRNIDGQIEVTVRVGRARATSRAVRGVVRLHDRVQHQPGLVSCCRRRVPYTRSNVRVRAPAHVIRGWRRAPAPFGGRQRR